MKPCLDTGWFKSGWIHFFIAPFFVLSWCGVFLIGSSVAVGGFSEPWWNQAIGLSLFLVFAVILSWLYLRALSREQVWITGDTITVTRKKWWSESKDSISLASVEAFELFTATEVFDLYLRTTDGKSLPIAVSLSSKRLPEWAQKLQGVAPMVYGKQKPARVELRTKTQ